MPRFSKRSKAQLNTCHSNIQVVFYEVINYFDCTVLEGHRDKSRQDNLYATGRSQLVYPFSRHNSIPANAADVLPCPINWADIDRMRFFAGFVLGIAASKGIHNLRWGGDWDRDTEVRDNRFNDLAHYELV